MVSYGDLWLIMVLRVKYWLELVNPGKTGLIMVKDGE